MRRAAYWMSLGVVFTVPWENVVEITGLGTVARAVGLLAALLWLMAQSLEGAMRRPDAFHVVAFGFVVWSGLTFFWSLDPGATLVQFFTLVQLTVFVLVMWDLYRTPQEIASALQAYVLGAWVTALSTLSNYVTSNVGSFEGRVTVGRFNFDTVGMILALGVPVAWYLARSPVVASMGVRWLKLVNYAYVPAGIFGLALTGTRTALLALLPAAVYVVWSLANLRSSRRVFALLFLVVAGFIVMSLMPEQSADRLGTTLSELRSGDFSARAEIWGQGVDAFFERPLAGVGAGAFRQAVERNQVAHNTLLSVVTETGVIGLVPFGFAVMIVVQRITRHPRHERRFWVALLWGVAVGASSLTWETKKIGWLFVGLVIASAANHLRDREHLRTAVQLSHPGELRR